MRQALISKSALMHNITITKKKVNNAKIMAYIKANAYGHGLNEIATVLSGNVDGVTVSDLKDAIFLTKMSFKGKVVLTSTIINQEVCEAASIYNFDLVIFLISNLDIFKLDKINFFIILMFFDEPDKVPLTPSDDKIIKPFTDNKFIFLNKVILSIFNLCIFFIL